MGAKMVRKAPRVRKMEIPTAVRSWEYHGRNRVARYIPLLPWQRSLI